MSNENKLYGELEMIKAARYGYEYHQDSQFPSLKFDEMAVNNFKQLLLSNKLQEEETGVKHFHMGDIMTNDLELDYPNYYVRIEDYQTLQSTLTTVTAERDLLKSDLQLMTAKNKLNYQDSCQFMKERDVYKEALEEVLHQGSEPGIYCIVTKALSQSEKGENGNG